jgi:hypothetical protein
LRWGYSPEVSGIKIKTANKLGGLSRDGGMTCFSQPVYLPLPFIPQNVTLDVCSLEQDLSLLQQGCDITGGLYLRIPQLQGLLQYLLVCSIHKMYQSYHQEKSHKLHLTFNILI